MGLNVNSVKFLLLAHERGIPFGNVLMIGRQSLAVTASEIRTLLELPVSETTKAALRGLTVGPDTYSEQLLRACGAVTVDSMDQTAYEGATVLHDLNLPVPDSLADRYDLILDGGSLEHVFNIPMAVRNYMKMLKVGGHYVCNTATNNYSGHGFYQLSPEFFFAAFAPENGFTVLDAILYEETGASRWYRISQPDDAIRRITFQNSVPAHLLVMARKNADAPVFEQFPQQRMYHAAWANPDVDVIRIKVGLKGRAFGWVNTLPPRLKWWVLNTWNTRSRFRKDMFTRVN